MTLLERDREKIEEGKIEGLSDVLEIIICSSWRGNLKTKQRYF